MAFLVRLAQVVRNGKCFVTQGGYAEDERSLSPAPAAFWHWLVIGVLQVLNAGIGMAIELIDWGESVLQEVCKLSKGIFLAKPRFSPRFNCLCSYGF